MSKQQLVKDISELWQQYCMLDQFYLSTKYQSYDTEAYDGEGAYYKSAEGFLAWIVDGCSADGKEHGHLSSSGGKR